MSEQTNSILADTSGPIMAKNSRKVFTVRSLPIHSSRVQTNGIRISLHPAQGGGGAVASVFGRSGAVTAAIGDYSVSQVTGAAVDSAVVHLAGAETITGAKTFSSDVTLSGNLNVAGNINQTGSGPTQWSGQEWTGTTVTCD